MKLPKYTFINEIPILAPRWRDMVVLIAARHVGQHNVIDITEGGHSWTGQYYAHGDTIKKYKAEPMPTKRGGTILLHPVPLDELLLYEGRG